MHKHSSILIRNTQIRVKVTLPSIRTLSSLVAIEQWFSRESKKKSKSMMGNMERNMRKIKNIPIRQVPEINRFNTIETSFRPKGKISSIRTTINIDTTVKVMVMTQASALMQDKQSSITSCVCINKMMKLLMINFLDYKLETLRQELIMVIRASSSIWMIRVVSRISTCIRNLEVASKTIKMLMEMKVLRLKSIQMMNKKFHRQIKHRTILSPN